MATFPIEYAQRTPSGQTAARPIVADTGAPYRALAQVGASITQIGAELQNQKNALDYSEGQRLIGEKVNAAYESLTGEEEADGKVWETLQKDLGTVQYKSGRVNNALAQHVNSIAPDVQQGLTNKHQQIVRKNTRDKFVAEGQTRLAKGDIVGYQDILDRRLATKDISMAEYQSLSRSALVDSAIESSRDMLASNDPDQRLAAMQVLASVPEMEEATTDNKEYANKLMSIARKQGDQFSEEANKQLTDLMISGKISTNDVMMRRNQLSDDDYQQWAKIAINPVDKSGNIIQATELKSASSDIWRGTINRQDFDARVRASLADPDGINEKQYADIVSAADRELKSSQAEDIRRFGRNAANVILGQYSGLLQFDATGNLTGVNLAGLSGSDIEDAKFRMHYLSLYEQGLRDFIAENPKASGKEFYQFANEQKMRYWNTSLEQMKALAKAESDSGRTPPKEYPDASWDDERGMWTVVRNGRLMGVR